MHILDSCLPGSDFVPLVEYFVLSNGEDRLAYLVLHFFYPPDPGSLLFNNSNHVECVENLRGLQNGTRFSLSDLRPQLGREEFII